MRDTFVRSYGFLRTTLIGGVIFLLPLIVVGALVGQFGQVVWFVAEAIVDVLPVHDVAGYGVVISAAVAIVLGLCFFAGLIARHQLGRWLSEHAERNLTLLYPRYAIYKDQLIGNIGGEVAEGRLKPVRVTLVDCVRLGLEVERDESGMVTIYLPSSPDPWSGTVALFDASKVERVDAPYVDVMTTFEKLGTDSLRIASRPARPQVDAAAER